ncbi:MAG: SUMF1/EgtB/PvdO family nonheme iron enzyme [Bacteroidetes bacterium]|nr:SUMF1/EgtB/PvdO family nonheme iron enzyme [Bacteroidota bacterium]MDA1333755.1 SUMF1/EgtB/PvdO family nonheme iron enzyme [Bacteroidota bacterium]
MIRIRSLPLFLLVITGCASVSVPAEFEAVGFEWVRLEGGPYLMGDSFEQSVQDALPVHGVRIQPFYVSRYETTLDQYDLFAEKTGRETVLPNESNRGTRAAGNMVWEDALAFCAFMGGRLPTEQEWEYAAAGGSKKQLYPGTDDETQMEEFVRYRENSMAESFPVGRKKPNAFGLFDMGGNVAEWIGEYYEFYPEPGQDPIWIDLSARELRLARGGGFSAEQHVARTYWRAGTLGTVTTPTIGVRCVRDP